MAAVVPWDAIGAIATVIPLLSSAAVGLWRVWKRRRGQQREVTDRPTIQDIATQRGARTEGTLLAVVTPSGRPNPSDLTDGELLRRARTGEQTAWDQLVDRLADRVWRVARAYRLNKTDAEDVFQLTWMRFVTRMDSIRNPEQVGAWLEATAHNECTGRLRAG